MTYPLFISHQIQVSLRLCVSGSRRTPQGESYPRIGPRHDRQRYNVLHDYQQCPINEHDVRRQVDVKAERPVFGHENHPLRIRHWRTQRQTGDPDQSDHAQALGLWRPCTANTNTQILLLLLLSSIIGTYSITSLGSWL